jgi:REP element-mobilizing transposase RayT
LVKSGVTSEHLTIERQFAVLDERGRRAIMPRMARPLRIERVGAWYHLTARGNERRAIYRDDRDRRHFCGLVAEMVKRFNVGLHAYVLMDNHYHLLVELREANLSMAVQYLRFRSFVATLCRRLCRKWPDFDKGCDKVFDKGREMQGFGASSIQRASRLTPTTGLRISNVDTS